jgi:hypothetical protein
MSCYHIHLYRTLIDVAFVIVVAAHYRLYLALIVPANMSWLDKSAPEKVLDIGLKYCKWYDGKSHSGSDDAWHQICVRSLVGLSDGSSYTGGYQLGLPTPEGMTIDQYSGLAK